MLRFCESFDQNGDITAKWTGTFGYWMPIYASGRFGTYGGEFVNIGHGTLSSDRGMYKDFPGAGDDKWTVGFAMRFYSYSNGNPVQICGLYEVGTGFHAGLWIDSSGRAVVRRGSTTLATSTATFPVDGNFHYVEFQAVIDDSAGTYEVRLDGVNILSGSSADTKNGGTGIADRINFLGNVGSGDGAVFAGIIDDIVIMDGVDSGVSGRPNNDFIGDVRVEAIFPSGNGNSSQLVGSDGNSTDNYLLVDESPTPNSDTDYVESATVGNKDTYAYGDLAASSGTVFGVQICPFAKRTDTGAREIKTIARLSGTEVDGPAVALPTGYTFNGSIDVREAKPGGGAWSISDVNSAEFGVKVSA